MFLATTMSFGSNQKPTEAHNGIDFNEVLVAVCIQTFMGLVVFHEYDAF